MQIEADIAAVAQSSHFCDCWPGPLKRSSRNSGAAITATSCYTTASSAAVLGHLGAVHKRGSGEETARSRRPDAPAVNLWVKGEPATRLHFERIGPDLTPYPFLHIFPQDQHERLLIDRLEALGVSVERRTDAILEKAHTLCGAAMGALLTFDGESFGFLARKLPPQFAEVAGRPFKAGPQIP